MSKDPRKDPRKDARPPQTVEAVLGRMERPSRVVVTSGMPYANGPLHLGHLAGAMLPADIAARFWRLVVGAERVLFVTGTDEHGSTSELAALAAGEPIADFVRRVHDLQDVTRKAYAISLDVYAGTSRPECIEVHTRVCQDFVRRLNANGLLEKRQSRQWFDPKMERFLPDRFVRGKCPNPRCDNLEAYSDECEKCGAQYSPEDMREPKSTISDATPELRETTHLWLDMWKVSETLRVWLEAKQRTWRKSMLTEVLERVRPALRIDREHEPAYRAIEGELPTHKKKYTPDKQVVLRFENKPDLTTAGRVLGEHGLPWALEDAWAHRSITRDTAWGVALPDEVDPELRGKTLYVWPDSLIAPISFCQVALRERGEPEERYVDYWHDPDARVFQFLGQDNVFFYVLMQGAMWIGSQKDPSKLPGPGELQLTDVMGACHLLVDGAKMSKSTGNFVLADELLAERGYDADQVRYYLALLGLSQKPSDFSFDTLDERNRFLAGPLNAAFERPLSAAHSKFEGRVPDGKLLDKVETATVRIVQRYAKSMARADYPNLIFEIENYARTVNALFSKYKPHDDRHPEPGRRDALYSSFYVLKNLMIMLYPFVPATMERLRESLRLPPEVFRIDELGRPIEAGHRVEPPGRYFPPASSPADSTDA